MPEKQDGWITMRQVAKMGGKARASQLGKEGYEALGKKGGSTTLERHGPEHFREAGKLGGAAVRDKYGPDYYSEIGKKGGGRTAELCRKAREMEASQEHGDGAAEAEL